MRSAGLAVLLLHAGATGANALIFGGEVVTGGNDVVVSDGVAYVCGTALWTFDASDPATGYTPLGTAPDCKAIEVRGSLAYVVGTGDLHILDISDPAHPAPLGAVPLPVPGLELEVDGGFAYVATNSPGIQIVDVSDPAAPVARGALSFAISSSPVDTASVAVEAGTAYLNSGNGTEVVDVTDPATPTHVTSLGFGTGFRSGIEVRDGVLYAVGPSGGDEAIRIFDVTNPAAPVELASTGVASIIAIELLGDFLYVLDFSGLYLLDVSDPTQPAWLGSMYVSPPEGVVRDVAATPGFAHVVSLGLFPGVQALLQAVDTSVPEFPRRSSIDGPLAAPFLEVSSDRLYAVHFGGQGVSAYDLTADPLTPSLLGSAPIPSAPPPAAVRDLEAVGDTVYLALNSILAVFDFGDPAQPQPLPSIASGATALTHRGDRLYVGTANGAIQIYDVSDPTAPTPLGSLPAPVPARIFDLDLAGDVLFATQAGVVRAIDVANPTAPHALDAFESFGPTFQAVAISGELLYVGGLGGPTYLLNASDPANLVEIGSILTFGLVRDLEVLGDRLYVGSGDSLLQVFDISQPPAPVKMGALIAGNRVELANGIAFVGTSTGGPVTIVDFGPEYVPTPQVGVDVAPNNPFNRINLTANGFVMVALLGSEDLDVASVDQGTLAFGPAGAPALLSTTSVANQDAHPDLFALFKVAQTGIAITDTQACLSGEMAGGQRFEGCDAIQPIAGCGGGFAAALLAPVALPLGRAVARRRRAPRA